MSDQATVDNLRTFVGVGSLGFGALAILSPGTLNKMYGMDDDSAALAYLGRMWGTRTALLGALTLTAGPEEQRRLALGGTALNTLDTLSVLATPGLSGRTRAMAGLTTAAFAAAPRRTSPRTADRRTRPLLAATGPGRQAGPMTDLTPQQTYELDRKHVFHSWVGPGAVPADGDHAGRGLARSGTARTTRYLDFSWQLVFTNIGHQHPTVVAAIQEQAAKLCTIAPQHANDARSEAARLVAEIAPDGLEHVFFTNGGAEAIEHAVRMARLHTGRIKVLSRYRSYHGGTNTAVNLTGDPRRWAVGLRLGRDREVLRPVPLPLGVRRDDRGGGVRARAAPPAPHRRARGPGDHRGNCARDDSGHRRDHAAAARLPPRRARRSATSTASSWSSTR